MNLKKTTFAIRLTPKCIVMLGSKESADFSWDNVFKQDNILRVDISGWLIKAWLYLTKKEGTK